jgi:RHS repeat-associated protein
VLTRTRYEAYGNTAAGVVRKGLGFTGHVNDPDTGLVYMQQRYFDPIAARFMSICLCQGSSKFASGAVRRSDEDGRQA